MTSLVCEWRKTLAVPAVPVTWAVLSVLAIIAGPFGTREAFSIWVRAAYWPGVIAVAILVGAGLRVVVHRVFGLHRYRAEAPVLAVFAVLTLTPPIYLVTRLLVRAEYGVMPHWAEVGFYVFVASLGVSAMRHVLAPRQPGGTSAAELGPPPGLALQPRILSRVEPGLQAPLIRLAGHNHYVDVVTKAGSAAVLMRFADAMAELDGLEGMQVHRSHWVAISAVQKVRRSAGRMALRMADGAEVPVSRTYQPAVVARGLTGPV